MIDKKTYLNLKDNLFFKAGIKHERKRIVEIVKNMQYGTSNKSSTPSPVCHGCCQGILNEIKYAKESKGEQK